MPKRTIAGDLPAPMLAKLQPEMPTGEGWTYEPKWDGFRTIVAVDEGGSARLASRDGRPLGRYFPELIGRLEAGGDGPSWPMGRSSALPTGRWTSTSCSSGCIRRSRVCASSPARSRPRSSSSICSGDGNDDLAGRPLEERRTRLGASRASWVGPRHPATFASMPQAPVALVAPWTGDTAVAQAWFDDEDGLGQDGILAKRADQAYLPGERGWVKVKHRRTLDVVIGGYRLSKTRDGIGALLLGLYDDAGTLHYVGHTSSFKAAERRGCSRSSGSSRARELRGRARAGRAEPVDCRARPRVGRDRAGARG